MKTSDQERLVRGLHKTTANICTHVRYGIRRIAAVNMGEVFGSRADKLKLMTIPGILPGFSVFGDLSNGT